MYTNNSLIEHETQRVNELSKLLKVSLSLKNFVQSHTPFQQLVHGSGSTEGLENKVVLVVGGREDGCRKVAERYANMHVTLHIWVLTDFRYGFKNVVTPGDIFTADTSIWPFCSPSKYKSLAKPLPTPMLKDNPEGSLKIDAILVFNDPRDWALDIQIILDLLLSSRGILGTYSSKNGDVSLPNNGWQQDDQPPIYFSNPDLFWASEYHLNRLGQGGFQASLAGVWEATTGGAKLQRTVIGKPHSYTYAYAEKVLSKYRAKLLRSSEEELGPISKVFMVGDNPESDIRGANEYRSPVGTEWNSILVNTGVYTPGTVPKYQPQVNVANVLDAVKWALKEQGWSDPDMNIE